MMFREKDAQTHLCPIMQPAGQLCHGSACMLWQPGQPEVEVYMIPIGLRVPTAPPDGDGWRLGVSNNNPAWIREIDKTGGCSLANK